jgi:hypothetical protein
LAREERLYNTELPLEVIAPPNVRKLGVRPTVTVRLLCVWFVCDEVEVLGQPIQQERQQLLCIVLVISLELFA